MNLGQKQRAFTRCLAELILFAYSKGYELTLGRGAVSEKANAADGGHPKSCHLFRLAQDLNLFRDGVYLTRTEDHQELGEYWERLGEQEGLPLRWGGRFEDGNHYSLEHQGVK